MNAKLKPWRFRSLENFTTHAKGQRSWLRI
jgi:hypothetical protein